MTDGYYFFFKVNLLCIAIGKSKKVLLSSLNFYEGDVGWRL